MRTKHDFLHALRTFQPDLILSKYQLPSFDGSLALKLVQEQQVAKLEIESTDRQIDRLFYELYGLSSDEIKTVEGKP